MTGEADRTSISPEAVINGTIHLMQVLPGIGEHYSLDQVHRAIGNVLGNYDEHLRAHLVERMQGWLDSPPEGVRDDEDLVYAMLALVAPTGKGENPEDGG